MQYVVIETGGKQYKINEGQILEVEHLKGSTAGETIAFDKVLLHVQDGNVALGTPYLTNVVVNAKVVDHVKGEKIHVSKFKAKSKYRRVTGHRQSLSRIEIAAITTAAKSTSKAQKA